MAQLMLRSDDTTAWDYGFGRGKDGSSYIKPSNEGCFGDQRSQTLHLLSPGTFANDDLVLLYQSTGPSAGTYMFNRIMSGAGTTELLLRYALTLSLLNSDKAQAQVLTMKEYHNLKTGSLEAPVWDGVKGGLLAFFDSGTTMVDGTIDISNTTAIMISDAINVTGKIISSTDDGSILFKSKNANLGNKLIITRGRPKSINLEFIASYTGKTFPPLNTTLDRYLEEESSAKTI
jgi:hypothetical protein